MIPADVASRLRLVLPDQPEPLQSATPTQKLPDVLSDLAPGQRIMAEIQGLLPNGMYRAAVAQRDITLALPFTAKAGDSLELEVVETDGKLTLAFVANRGSGEQGGVGHESVSTTLSQTGKLIGTLLAGIDAQGKEGKATPLNSNHPLLDSFPKDASQLVPVLKEALTNSGMFYEAHQAQWAEGKLPTEALLQEPQGKLSPILHNASSAPGAGTSLDASPVHGVPTGNTIPGDLAPLVRQQLDALATQNFVWQGQVWPGQQMDWEIENDSDKRQGTDENASQQWHTRLKLTLPALGGIDAVMRLRPGGSLEVAIVADNDQTRQRLSIAGEQLRRQLEDAGLNLTGLAVQHGEATS